MKWTRNEEIVVAAIDATRVVRRSARILRREAEEEAQRLAAQLRSRGIIVEWRTLLDEAIL